MKQPIITDIYTRNAYAKKTVFPYGARLPQHVHDYDHFSFVGKGRFRVLKYHEMDGKGPYEVSEHGVGEMIIIQAGILHEMMALEDGSIWYCLHGIRPNDSLADVTAVEIADAPEPG